MGVVSLCFMFCSRRSQITLRFVGATGGMQAVFESMHIRHLGPSNSQPTCNPPPQDQQPRKVLPMYSTSFLVHVRSPQIPRFN